MPAMPPVTLPPTPPAIGAATRAADGLEPAKAVPPTGVPDLPATGPNSLVMWKSRMTESQDVVDRLKVSWDVNQDRYLAKRPLGGHESDIIVPIDYANVEQKKAALFFQNPKILISPLLPGLEKAAPIFEAVVNYRLGRKGVNAKAAVDEVLSDALCSSGIFAVKIGYEATTNGTKQIQTGTGPDPNWKPTVMQAVGAQMGLMEMPQAPIVPIMEDVPNIIAEKYIFDRISPAKLLIPSEFNGSDYDKAPWLAFEFLMELETARKLFSLPPEFNTATSEDTHLVGARDSTVGKGKSKKVRGWEIYFKTSVFDPSQPHPDHQTLLVIIDGVPTPVKNRPSPYQVYNPDGTIGGMPGFPIHVGALRYVSDSAYPPSDCQMSRHQSDEISKGRTQMMWQRLRSTPMRIVDLAGIGGTDGLAKLEKNIWQGIFPVTNLDPMPIREVPLAHMPQQNFEFDSLAKRDLAETWAMGSNQMGTTNATGRTATELTLAQNNGSTRLGKERTKFLDWFVRGAEKHAALIQMFADEQSYINIVGPDGAKTLMSWDKTTVQGTYAFDIKANSSAPTDAASDRAQLLQFYNLMGNSPGINRKVLDAEVIRAFDLEPDKLLLPPAPPVEPPPEKPKISFSFDDKAIDPSNPAFPIIMEIMKNSGIVIDNKAIIAAQAAAGKMQTAMGATTPVVADAVPHPDAPPPGAPGAPGGSVAGAAPGGPPQGGGNSVVPLNKHQQDQTGARPGPRVGGVAELKK